MSRGEVPFFGGGLPTLGKRTPNIDWRPIETAPKDGTEILAFGMAVEGFPRIMWDDRDPRVPAQCVIRWVEGWYDDFEPTDDGAFRKVRKQGYAYWGPNPQQFQPTHWMPLPDPPKED